MSPVHMLAVALTAVAAFTDARAGRIPNWLTVPVLALAPIYHGMVSGLPAAMVSIVAIAVCGALPFLMFMKNAMGGGDVKLFAALGALLHPVLGVEVQFLSYLAVAFLLLARTAWEGRLFATCANVGRVFVNVFLPKRMRKPLEPALLTEMRMGIAIFAATILSLLWRGAGGAL